MISTQFYRPWHLKEMGPLRKEFKFDTEFRLNMNGVVHRPDTPTFTIFFFNQPIGVIGGFFDYPDVMKVYALLTDGIKEKPIAFHKEVKRIIQNYFDVVKIKRMEMDVRSDFKEAQKWAKSLGFHVECVKKNYGYDCSEYYSYVRFQ